MAAAVLDKIARKCQEIERAGHQGICGERELCAIDNCARNAQRIAHFLSPETFQQLTTSLDDIRTMVSTHLQSEGTGAFSISRSRSGEFQAFKNLCLFAVTSYTRHLQKFLFSFYFVCLFIWLLCFIFSFMIIINDIDPE